MIERRGQAYRDDSRDRRRSRSRRDQPQPPRRPAVAVVVTA